MYLPARLLVCLLLCTLVCTMGVEAREIIGNGWRVLYNLPDGSSFRGFSEDEFELRDALVNRLDQLGPRDEAILTTFTFSGNETGAGRILYAMDQALQRGATVRFIVDRKEKVEETFTNNTDKKPRSLEKLAAHPKFTLAVDNSKGGIMHHKFALFDYRGSGRNGGRRYILTSSLNITGASSFQWNVAIELIHPTIYTAFRYEAEEMLAGRFHRDPQKSHAHDNKLVQFDGGMFRTRFGPSPKRRPIAEMVESGLRSAKQEIVFALNFISDEKLADGLIAAAQRGVKVVGVVSLSEEQEKGVIRDTTRKLRKEPKIEWVKAFAAHGKPERDTGKQKNLVHTKYIVIDRIWTLHGSANWTVSAMRDENENDENLLIIRHPDIADAFLQQFEAMTGRVIREK